MADIFATAWLISLPFVLFVLGKRGRVLFEPSSRLVQAVLITILFGNAFLAIGALLAIRPMLFNTSLFHWGGFLLLCFIWIRGIYLLRAKSIEIHS